MKKIIIKEQAEFNNDIQNALEKIPVILDMDNAVTVTPYNSDGVLTLEITAHLGDANAGSDVTMEIVMSTETTGGEQEREQTYDSPAEYADTNTEIVSIDELHYSEEFVGDETGTRDINGIEISQMVDNELFAKIVNFAYKHI